MKLIEDEREETGALPEPEPRYHTATLPAERTEHGQSLVRIIASILAAIILIVLIVLLARWIYHAAHNSSEPPPTKVPSVNTPAAPSTSGTDEQQPANSNSGAAPTASPNNATNNTAPNNGQTKLPNNGPGNVIGLFVGTSLAAAGLHYIVCLRRFAGSR